MLSVIFIEFHMWALYAECRYAEYRYAECRGALTFLEINATYSRSHDTNTIKISATGTGNGYVNATDICSTNIIITLVPHALGPMAIALLTLATKTLAPSFLVPLTLIPTTFVPMTIVRLQRSSAFIESFLALFCHLVLTRLRYPPAKMPNVVQPFAVWSNVGAPQSFWEKNELKRMTKVSFERPCSLKLYELRPAL